MEHLEGEAVVKLRREKSYPIIKELEKWCKEEGLVDHVLKKDTVSRLHARIDQTEQGYTVTDLNSTNGVRVGKQILQANETVELKMGDELYLADAGFLFL